MVSVYLYTYMHRNFITLDSAVAMPPYVTYGFAVIIINTK